MKKFKTIKICRTIVQILFFIFLPALISLAFFQVKALFIDLINFNYSQIVSDCIVIILLSILTMLAGRIFCGWMCIFGAYNDWVYIISNKIFKNKYKINKELDKNLKYIKYIVLAVIILFIWTGILAIPEGSSPWDAYTQIFDIKFMLQQYFIGSILLLIITLGAIFVERFFCRYLCPLGAIFSILSKCKIFKINKEKTACGNCKACSVKCSMGIDLDSVEKVNSGECIQCLNCVGICPKENARMKFLNKDIDEKSFFTIVISLFVGTYALTNSLITYNLQNNSNTNNLSTEVNQNTNTNTNTNTNINSGKSSNTNVSKNTNTNTNFNTNTNNSTSTNTNKSTNTNSNTNTSAVSSTKYKDGTYTGVGRGYRDGLTVSVTIKNNKITNIAIVSINDTPGYYEKATNIVPKEIINSQSTKVNTVSGATRSSNGIISAVNDALSEALI